MGLTEVSKGHLNSVSVRETPQTRGCERTDKRNRKGERVME